MEGSHAKRRLQIKAAVKVNTSFNLMLGATYATPVGGNGSGNIDPFVGFGYSF